MLKEKYGDRCLSYSAWHRPKSIERFVDFHEARVLSMIDLDVTLYLEYQDETKMPLVLIEVARDVGQEYKCCDVTKNLAILANKPCLLTLYTLSEKKNPADNKYCDIDIFRVRKILPEPETPWKEFTPKEYAEMLSRFRHWEVLQMDKKVSIDQ